MKSGVWVVVEGSDACGKSTLINHLAIELTKQIDGANIFLTREPGSLHSPLTSKIRDLLKATDNEPPAHIAETMLFLADRAHHYNKVIIPNLNQNKVIIQDRGYLSTIAYQCGLRQFPIGLLTSLHQLIFTDRYPDVIFWLDTPLDVTLERLNIRKPASDDITTFDRASMQEIIYAGYRRLFENQDNSYMSPRMYRLSGLLDPAEISKQAYDYIVPLLHR